MDQACSGHTSSCSIAGNETWFIFSLLSCLMTWNGCSLNIWSCLYYLSELLPHPYLERTQLWDFVFIYFRCCINKYRAADTLSKKVIKWYKVLSKKCMTKSTFHLKNESARFCIKDAHSSVQPEQTVRRWTPLGGLGLPAKIVAKFSVMQMLGLHL